MNLWIHYYFQPETYIKNQKTVLIFLYLFKFLSVKSGILQEFEGIGIIGRSRHIRKVELYERKIRPYNVERGNMNFISVSRFSLVNRRQVRRCDPRCDSTIKLRKKGSDISALKGWNLSMSRYGLWTWTE